MKKYMLKEKNHKINHMKHLEKKKKKKQNLLTK